jgi:hypothetical protein
MGLRTRFRVHPAMVKGSLWQCVVVCLGLLGAIWSLFEHGHSAFLVCGFASVKGCELHAPSLLRLCCYALHRNTVIWCVLCCSGLFVVAFRFIFGSFIGSICRSGTLRVRTVTSALRRIFVVVLYCPLGVWRRFALRSLMLCCPT